MLKAVVLARSRGVDVSPEAMYPIALVSGYRYDRSRILTDTGGTETVGSDPEDDKAKSGVTRARGVKESGGTEGNVEQQHGSVSPSTCQ